MQAVDRVFCFIWATCRRIYTAIWEAYSIGMDIYNKIILLGGVCTGMFLLLLLYYLTSLFQNIAEKGRGAHCLLIIKALGHGDE